MKKYQTLKIVTIIAALVLTPLTGCADSDSRDGNRRHGGPPPEAIKACEGKQVGDTVEFTGRRGETLQATCREIEGQLAAVPAGRPPRGDRN